MLVSEGEDSVRLESSLKLLPQKLRAQPPARVIVVDATSVPDVSARIGVVEPPAVLLYDHGSCVTTLQKKEVITLSPGSLAQVVSSFFRPS